MFFVGTYPLTIDSKCRLSIPFVVRDRMMAEADGRAFFVLPGRNQGTLVLYPNQYFEQTRRHAFPSQQLTDEAYAWQQFEFSQSALVEPDSQGRILIPDRLLKRAGLVKEVVLIGVQDHLELWPREAYEAFEAQQWQDYGARRQQAVEELTQLGAFAASPPPAEVTS